ncbi:AMP-binding protein [Roseovarius sp. EL26]|uniref:AMP-binding protein n=1 Tax=Roseovarius sp. EL26 TaxID=2126672 RepID=UPI0013C50E2B|nr:AMP-binding protein [Roseovarius sp. EL26]
MNAPLETICIEAENSVEFLEQVFRCDQAGQLFAIQRTGLDLAQYPGLSVTQTYQASGGKTGWGQLQFAPADDPTAVQIMFSSGTEGTPKAIVISRQNISDVVRRLNHAMDIDDRIREYVGIPVSYSFGLGRIRAISAVGGKFFLPERFDPSEIRTMLDAGEINAISAVPSLWRLILSTPESIGSAGEKVRWIEIGSQYMSAEEKAGMKTLFPNARIIQHYGLTEASRTTFLNISANDGSVLDSVGSPVPPTGVKIGSQGEICIRGPHVALGQLDKDGTIQSLTDDQGWLHTRDKGALRDGMLFYHGRLDDQMNISGIKLSAEHLERQITTLCGCDGQFAVTRIDDSLRGDAVLLAVSNRIDDKLPLIKSATEIALKRAGVNLGGSLHILQLDELPVTGSGKIRRSALREQYTQKSTEQVIHSDAPAAELTVSEAQIAEAWHAVIGGTAFDVGSSFYDLGGDSLSALQIGLKMEGQFKRATINATLEGRTLREVAATQTEDALAESPTQTSPDLPIKTVENWAINIARGLMVLSVLVSHWGPGFFARLGLEEQADNALGWLYQMGTEGFATIFGIGLGYLFVVNYPANKTSFTRRQRWSLALVFSALLITAAVKLTLVLAKGQAIDQQAISFAFYNVLAYYCLALIGAGLWFKYLTRTPNVIRNALIIAIIGVPLYWLSRYAFPAQLDTLLEWPRLMLVGAYSYFRLTAIVFGGIAVGYWFARQTDRSRATKTLREMGAFGMVLSLIVGLSVMPFESLMGRASPFFGGVLGILFYFAISVFLIGMFIPVLTRWSSLPSSIMTGCKILITLGGLALPIYAFHGLVIPIKDLLVIMGLPGVIALGFSMGAFLISIGYGGVKLWKMYFN